MTARSSPSVLLFAVAGAEGDGVAAILAEAGIAITMVHDEDSALRATANEHFDLAIVVTTLPDAVTGTELLKSLRRERPALEILYIGEMGSGRRRDDAGGFDARRLVGCVRERLAGTLDAAAAARARNTAEFAIAEARIGCLYHRAENARGGVARDLAREIDAAIAQRETLRRVAPVRRRAPLPAPSLPIPARAGTGPCSPPRPLRYRPPRRTS